MKLTRKQREQVVELLRCAADRGSIGAACSRLGVFGGPVHELAIAVWSDTVRVLRLNDDLYRETYSSIALEAAQRVEEGSWP